MWKPFIVQTSQARWVGTSGVGGGTHSPRAFDSAVLTAARSVSGVIGFWTKSRAPSFIASTARSIEAKAVTMSTVQFGSISRMPSSVCTPSMPGRR